MRWTQQAAIERMRQSAVVQQVCAQYPLVRVLLESAARVRGYAGYSFDLSYVCYKDWLDAIGMDSLSFEVCTATIADLLPESCFPPVTTQELPGLPPAPPVAMQGDQWATLAQILALPEEPEHQRAVAMRDILKQLTNTAIAQVDAALDKIYSETQEREIS